MEWTIYCHTHINSGRRYIGLTKHTMLKRWNRHVYSALRSLKTGCSHFSNAIRKYGKDAFSHEVLEVCHDLEIANMAEECWVEFYETRNPNHGFNLAKGGAHTPHPKRNPWDRPEYRIKITASLKAEANSPAGKARRSVASKSQTFKQRSVKSKETSSRPEVQAKIAASVAECWSTKEGRTKYDATRKPVSWSSEDRIRIAEFMKTRPVKDESRERISASLKGRKIGFAAGNGFQKPPSKQTHCKHGHSLHNAYIVSTVCRGYKYNARFCRVCAYFKRKPERRIILEVMSS